MIEHVLETGDTGRLKIIDKTEGSNKTVEFWIQSLSPVSAPQLPWAHSIDADRSGWRSFNFKDTTMWQRLGAIFVVTGTTVTLHLGNTGRSQLNGPTDFTVNLAGTAPTPKVSVKVGNRYRLAIPYVRDNGVWKQAEPFARTDRGWRSVT